MDRRTFGRDLLVAAVSAPVATNWWGRSEAAAAPGRGRHAAPTRLAVVEYQLPPTGETHEIIQLAGTTLVLVSQMSNSTLVKLQVDRRTERVGGVRAFPIGPPEAMLHGLAPSRRYPGRIWATQEGADRLLLIDPGAGRLDAEPQVVRTIDIPEGGKGPHYVGEYDDQLWVSLKGSDQVLSISHTDPRQYRLYPTKPHPIFVARHPETGDFYVSQDLSSQILRIDPASGNGTQIEVPGDRGTTPVGLVAGPGGVWFVLLGSEHRGTGTFGRIDGRGEISWFRLTSPLGRQAGLLHLAFGSNVPGEPLSAWLLSSSIVAPTGLDAIIHVKFDDTYTEVQSEDFVALPTQQCKAHRLLPLGASVLATELTSATVAQLRRGPD
jgi:virginiamycin B lyase